MAITHRATRPVPFWHQLPAITLYPVRGAALYSLLALTFASLLAFIPLVGWLISIVTWLAVYKYAFEILRATANGHMAAPEGSLGVDDGVVPRMILMQLIFFGVVIGLALAVGPAPALIALLVIALMQPGCMMSLSMDGSLRHALNPLTALAIALRVGWPYLAVFCLLFVIQASAATAGVWLSRFLPPVVGGVALNFVSFWGIFAAFHLMGYLVYQFHEELGFQPDRHTHGVVTQDHRDADLLDEAGIHVNEGRNPLALELLRAEVRSRAVSLEVHEVYHRLMHQAGDKAGMADHAGVHINLLLNEKQHRRALAVLAEAMAVDPELLPVQPDQGEHLAGLARMSGQHALAADILQSLLRRHPRHANASQWALDAALLLADRLNRDADAVALLEAARTRCDDPATLEKIDATLKPLRLIAQL